MEILRKNTNQIMYQELIKAAKRSGKSGYKLHRFKNDQINSVPDNHYECLVRLQKTLMEIGKTHFPEMTELWDENCLWEIIRKECYRNNLAREFLRVDQRRKLQLQGKVPLDMVEDEPFVILGEIFQSKQLFVHAFMCYLVASKNTTWMHVGGGHVTTVSAESPIEKAKALKSEIGSDDVLKLFQPGFVNVLSARGLTLTQYLTCRLDKYSAQYYAVKNYNEQVILDAELHYMRSRIQCKDYKDVEELCFSILLSAVCRAMSPKCKRFRQARHMISVATELMKGCENKNSQMYKELSEVLIVVKCAYWGMILAFTELRNVFVELLEGTDDQMDEMFTFREELIDMIELPEGEDEQLPVILLETDEERLMLHRSIEKYKRKMKKAVIKELQEIYTDIRRVDVNYFIPEKNPFSRFKENKDKE